MFRDGAERFLVFRVGVERFAVPLAAVHEVIDAPLVQPIPDAGANVLGVATIRGELVPVYDPRPILTVDGTVDGAALLFDCRERRIGLAVDDVYDAISLNPDEIRPVPGMDASDGTLAGVARRDGTLIGVLDADALLGALLGVAPGACAPAQEAERR